MCEVHTSQSSRPRSTMTTRSSILKEAHIAGRSIVRFSTALWVVEFLRLWYNRVQPSIVWYRMVQDGVAWYGTVKSGMVCYGTSAVLGAGRSCGSAVVVHFTILYTLYFIILYTGRSWGSAVVAARARCRVGARVRRRQSPTVHIL